MEEVKFNRIITYQWTDYGKGSQLTHLSSVWYAEECCSSTEPFLIMHGKTARCIKCNKKYNVTNIEYEDQAPKEFAIAMWADLEECRE